MTKLKKVFQRKENKYSMDFKTYEKLRRCLQDKMNEDEYGLHTIISVYYDTKNYDLIQKSILKPKYREKLRLRSYGIPNEETTVFLEIKKKVKGIVYKRRIGLAYQIAKEYNHENLCLDIAGGQNKQIQQELNWMVRRNQLAPKVVIAYDRIAMKAKEEELAEFRLTFDFAIRYRKKELDISLGDHGERVAPEMDVLMEVKALGSYPIWFSKILSELNIHKGSFSKYAQTYQRYLLKEEVKDVG